MHFRIVLATLATLIGFLDLAAAKWQAVNPKELAATVSEKDKTADAEVLYSSIDLSFQDYETTKSCYRRIKVYTERGVELVRKFSIESSSDRSISGLTARLTKPGGAVQEFAKKDFHDTTLLKIGGEKWTSRRLLLATLAPGDIVELRWEESWDGWAYFQFVYCQETLPVRDFTFNIEIHDIKANLAWYNVPQATMKKPNDNHITLTISDLPAYESEPDMPPELDVRGYILIAYEEFDYPPAQGWLYRAVWLQLFAKKQTAPNDKIRKLAQSLVNPGDTNEEKYRRLYAYCQEKIINVDHDESPQSVKERTRQKEPKTAAQVLKTGRGNALEVNLLYAALVQAADCDARLVSLCDQDLLLNSNVANGWYFSAPGLIAAMQSGEWAFFNPGNPLQSFGELRWQEEGASALLSDPDNMVKVTIAKTPGRKNVTTRAAVLELAADGTLSGEATLRYTGQAALQWRIRNRKEPVASIEKELREEITNRLPGAEVTAIRLENERTPGQPLLIRYHLLIPAYATNAGERLFLVPNVFEQGTKPRYASDQRQHPFFFPYAYKIVDDIRIVLPSGYTGGDLEAPKQLGPQPLPVRQVIECDYLADSRTLTYKREFYFGTEGSFYFNAKALDKRLKHLRVESNFPYQVDETIRTTTSQAFTLSPVPAAAVTRKKS